jgi:hypothetical protein
MATTAQIIITASLQALGAVAAGETPSTEDLALGLSTLNLLTESWSTDKNFIFGMQSTIQNLVTATQSYTIGTGGTFNVTRPIKIEDAKLVLVDPGATSTGKLRLPLDIINHEQFAALNPRTLAGTTPLKMYNDHAVPLSTLYFWPIPTFATNTPQVELFYWIPLTTFATLSTSVDLAPGYSRALTYNLAVDLMPAFGTVTAPTAPAIINLAKQSADLVRGLNAQIEDPNFDTQPPTAPTQAEKVTATA